MRVQGNRDESSTCKLSRGERGKTSAKTNAVLPATDPLGNDDEGQRCPK